MKDEYISDTCIALGKYLTANKATIRETAATFGLSKTTVHTLLTQKLQYEDFFLYTAVRYVLDENTKDRARRGGNARKKNGKEVEAE